MVPARREEHELVGVVDASTDGSGCDGLARDFERIAHRPADGDAEEEVLRKSRRGVVGNVVPRLDRDNVLGPRRDEGFAGGAARARRDEHEFRSMPLRPGAEQAAQQLGRHKVRNSVLVLEREVARRAVAAVVQNIRAERE